MHRKEIGRKSSLFYDAWSSAEHSCGNSVEAARVLAAGVAEQAQPSHLLLAKLHEYGAAVPAPTHTCASAPVPPSLLPQSQQKQTRRSRSAAAYNDNVVSFNVTS
jgi:hypothetical protein